MKSKLDKARFCAVSLFLGVTLYMSFIVADSAPFIGLMLGGIATGAYIMIVSRNW